MNPILLGTAEVFDLPKLNTVWLDKAGKLGIVTAISTEGWALQTDDMLYQHIPFEHLEIFQKTVECLGEL